jgi:hypothetical protein
MVFAFLTCPSSGFAHTAAAFLVDILHVTHNFAKLNGLPSSDTPELVRDR